MKQKAITTKEENHFAQNEAKYSKTISPRNWTSIGAQEVASIRLHSKGLRTFAGFDL
jgi:hypothetical protein